MSYTKRAVKGFVIVFIISMIAAFLGYVIRIVLARNLSLEEYGLFFAVYTLIFFLGFFSSLGFTEAIVKFIPEFLVKKKFINIKNCVVITFFTVLATNIFLGVVLFLLADFLAVNYFKNALAKPVLLVFIIAMIITSLKWVVRSVFQAFQRMLPYSVMYLVENFLILLSLLLSFYVYKGIFVAVYSHVFAYLFVLLIFSLFLFKVFNLFRHKISFKKDLFKKLLKFGIPVVLASVGGIIILYTDTLILTYFRPLSEVAVYNVVVPTVMIIMFFGKSISSVLFPMASELWAMNKKKHLEQGLIMLEKYSFLIVVPVSFVLLAFSKLFLELFFGDSYASGAVSMQILIVGIIFLLFYSINSALFSAIGRPQEGTKILLQGALINFLLNLLIIPFLGMLGAAITSLITYIYVFLVSVHRLRKFIKVSIPWSTWLRTLLAGVFMLLVIFSLKKLLFMNVYAETIIISVIAGIVYLVFVLLVKIIDIKEVKDLLRRII